ncbi:MAG: class I SAM-dependent methyltransferase [Oscillospiraceae bacterium]
MYRAGPPTLGARLLAAAGQVRRGRTVADIGCDHGKLAVWLALRGGAPGVIAVDSRPMPLARAAALVRRTGCAQRVQLRLGNGLAALAPGEAEDIVIAGLSGETIVDLLAACAWAKDEKLHFVLVPTTHPERLRRWLCEAGFEIGREVPVLEKGRAYTVMSVGYTGAATTPAPLFCQLGRIAEQRGPAAAAYTAARLAHLEKEARAPRPPKETAAHRRLIQEVASCLQSMQ